MVHQQPIFFRRGIHTLLFQPMVWSIDQKPWFMWNQRAMKPIIYTIGVQISLKAICSSRVPIEGGTGVPLITGSTESSAWRSSCHCILAQNWMR